MNLLYKLPRAESAVLSSSGEELMYTAFPAIYQTAALQRIGLRLQKRAYCFCAAEKSTVR